MTRPSRRIVIAAVAALLLVVAVAATIAWAKSVETAAVAGKAHAEAGARSLAAKDATAAASEFAAAKTDFASAQSALGPDWVAGVLGAVPWGGRQYSAARALTEIGLDGSAAGTELSGLLQDASASSETTDRAVRLGSLLVASRIRVEAAFASLSDAEVRASGLSASGLVGRLSKEVLSAQSMLRKYSAILDRGRALLPMLSYLASGDHRILVVSQDGAELKPTGGFAGSFGIIDVGPAGVRLEAYHNVYALPMPPQRVIPPPGARMTPTFSFRDANWWLDFPTSARAMLQLWGVQGQAPVDGLVAIDTVTIGDLLAITGPIDLPAYGETFTSENLLARLLFVVEVKLGDTAGRKDVLSALATELEKRLVDSGATNVAKAATAIATAADEKHVQVYFTDGRAQAAVVALGWSGRVALPPGTTDLLAVSNAMNFGSKGNAAMKKSIEYDVALQGDRSAETTLVLSYASTGTYPASFPTQLASRFRDWLRVYRAPGTVFPVDSPDGTKTVTTEEFGFPAEVRTLDLRRGQSRIETLTAEVPAAVRVVSEAAAKHASSAYYRLHVVRQDDLEDIPATVTVTAPPGWRVTGASALFSASGTQVPVTVEGGRVRVVVPLQGDLDLNVLLALS